jgi:ATP-dependent DNA helicase DinG
MNPEEGRLEFITYRNKKFRPYQKEAIEYVTSNKKKYIFLEAPTGSGKSLIAMVSGVMKGGTTYSVHSKVLQSQITSDFPEAKSLFGRSNYPCRAHEGLNCDECFHTTQAPCDQKKFGCVYEEEKRTVLRSRLRILNYDYLLSEANYVGKFSKSLFNIVDEADNLENTLINFISLTFTTYALSRLGLSEYAKTLKQSSTNKTELLNSWVCFGVAAKEQAIRIITALTTKIEGFTEPITPEEQKVIKEKSKVVRLLEKIDIFLTNVDSSWLLDNSQEDKYIFRPLWLNINLAEQFMWRHSAQWVLMSASFLPLHLECKRLGIPLDEADYMPVPSNFPTERRPIYVETACNLTGKTMDEEVPKMVKRVKEIINLHPKEKGLIHAVSYKLANKIIEGVNSPRLIVHNAKDRQDVLDYFISSPDPLVLISPSLDRGVSLEMDLCRFIIVAKAPFLYLGDKIVAARVYSSKMGSEWYAAVMLTTVLQMCGRGMRSADDRCEAYILDEQFKRVLEKKTKYLPMWFRDAIV